jgi:transcription-repair coupling factor (superfamily II helicase)
MISKIELKVGQNHTPGKIVEFLIKNGYQKVDEVLENGDFSYKGDSMRVFLSYAQNPVSIEFFGDLLEKISVYDKITHSKLETTDSVEIASNCLYLTDKSTIYPGSVVVHEDYGIGRFDKLITKTAGGIEIKYIVLKYQNDDILYVPTEQIIKLSGYIGVGRKQPKLSRLGSIVWQKTYKKVYESIIHMARELLLIYATREITKKESRNIYPEWNDALQRSFGFVETPDQQKAIADVFFDLQKAHPTERLICGDVGFGKTEIALRAAAQTIANGYQVAMLVPTTILAEQHFVNLKKRFADLPVSVEHVSRFLSSSQCNEIFQRTKNGQVDLLIGTHKLLSSVIEFKKLGMLIIDEEQKFGVKDKEKLKKLSKEIDVLSLTATPIPRTLFMSLSGIREISLIGSVPIGRKSIETYIEEYDRDTILAFAKREFERGGQVYFLHNEVQTILGVRNWLAQELPDKRIEIAHGQMTENALSSTMRDFADGKIDLLVCSTIIENGLDLANANTLIVDKADHFGLSQLYQIRGRIGRSNKQAYAFFLHNGKLTDTATRRLKALAENTELGTGYNIALHDLEIRGGGNILGREQHGNMESIGLVLYSKLLKLAVERVKKAKSEK